MPKINKLQSLIYLAMNMIGQDDKLSEVIPEIIYTMDENSLVRFLRVCGGRTIRVPTLDELALNLITSVCAYKIIKENYTLDMIFNNYEIPDDYKKYITEKLTNYISNMSEEEREFIDKI